MVVLCQLGNKYYAIVWSSCGSGMRVWKLEKEKASELGDLKTCWYLAYLHGKHDELLYGWGRTIVFIDSLQEILRRWIL